ncbi:AcrR family transcriptional regulator [Arthrobacter pigmenti]|uniref:AcrR family transcriptional regulator n=1 Tax=Arthrobacter pigmenti TaxID=271432 RepID=A0A846RJZ8_9MICC|nr:TetR/AcrR family transcriptional regulator [Arthrobacter pigmenti]NJC21469.1 AcrR family transcriptional regulator [Arthrobacter pigmenti]
MVSKVSGSRQYRSALREEQALLTRQRVLEAAGRCFAEKGFTTTTLGAIAEAAGVSVETVQIHGPKRKLLLGALESSSAGVPDVQSILEVPEARAVMEEPDARAALVGLAQFAASLNARIGRLWQAVAAAAQGDAEVAAAYAGLQSRIRADFVKVAEAQVAKGGARTHISTKELADTLWVLTSPYQYELLVTEAGWSEEGYRTWLERIVVESVLT